MKTNAWKYPPRPRKRFNWWSLAPVLLLLSAVWMAGVAFKAVGQVEFDVRMDGDR